MLRVLSMLIGYCHVATIDYLCLCVCGCSFVDAAALIQDVQRTLAKHYTFRESNRAGWNILI